VNVVGHLAIGPDRDAEAPAALGEPVAIERIVVGRREDALAAMAALRDVVRGAGNDDAGDAGYETRVAWRKKSVKAGVSP